MGLKSPLKTQGWNDLWYPGWNFGLKNSGLKCHVTSWCNASIQNSGEPFLSRWRMSLCRSVKCKSPSGAKWKRSSKPETLCLLFLQNLCPSEWIWNKTDNKTTTNISKKSLYDKVIPESRQSKIFCNFYFYLKTKKSLDKVHWKICK